MRSLLLAVLATIAIPACTQDITGGQTGPSGGDDQGSGDGQTCTCPDGSIIQGDDCATVCPAPNSGAGLIAVTTDALTYNTQLMQTVTANVTVTGSEGFSGMVSLAGAITDSTGTAVDEWPVTFDTSTVSVTMNGTATAKATITIPSTATPSMANTLTVTATPSTTSVTAGTVTAQIAASNTLEIDMSTDGSKCTFPAATYATSAGLQVAVGTVINWKNVGTSNNFVIHVDGNNSGIFHQGDSGAEAPATTAPGAIWPETVTAIGSGKVTWHCHAPADNGPAPGPAFTIVMPE